LNFSGTKLERHAPLAAGLGLALMTLVARYVPMTDLPMHEGVVGLLRHFGDETYMPKGLYVLNFGHPNQIFYVVAWALSYVVSTSMAVKIVIAAAQTLIFVGGARLADYVGRERWGALLLTPLALGFTYYWGLVANLVGLAGILLALPTLDRDAENPSLRGALRTSGILLLLFFAHESIFVSAAVIVGMLALLRRTWKDFALTLFPSIFAAGIALGHLRWQERFFTRVQTGAPVIYMSPLAKIESVPNVLFGSHAPIERLLLTFIALVALAIFVGGRIKEPAVEMADAIEGGRIARLRAFCHRFRFELIGAVHVLAFFTVPFTWNAATLLHERFLGPGWAIFAVLATSRAGTPRVGKLVAAVTPIAVVAISWPQFVDASRTYSDLDAIIAAIPKNAAVTQAIVDRAIIPTRVYSATTAPARVVADRGGRGGLTLTFSPISPVVVAPEYRWDEYTFRIAYMGSSTLRPAWDLDRWEWVVAQSRDPAVREAVVEAFRPDAEFVTARGEWMLFHSTHPQVPMTSPERLPPEPFETIFDRVLRVIRATRAAPPPSP
jgi:hypothetical protein